jgi:acylphosphatase
MIRRRVVVRGTVQGVFFRSSTQREAQRRHVSGWVTNRADGAVEAVFEGEPADVEALVTWAAGVLLGHVDTGDPRLGWTPRGEHHFRVVSDRG